MKKKHQPKVFNTEIQALYEAFMYAKRGDLMNKSMKYLLNNNLIRLDEKEITVFSNDKVIKFEKVVLFEDNRNETKKVAVAKDGSVYNLWLLDPQSDYCFLV